MIEYERVGALCLTSLSMGQKTIAFRLTRPNRHQIILYEN
jgi:hypothetical protein